MMTTNDIVKKYGKPNETGEGYLTTILLPYPMKLAWDLDTKVSKMRCHKLAAEPFLNVFNDLLAHYGMNEIERLGIDYLGVVLITERCEVVRNGQSIHGELPLTLTRHATS